MQELLQLIAYIAVIGVIVGAILYVFPMPEIFKRAIYAITAIALVILVFRWLGWFQGFSFRIK